MVQVHGRAGSRSSRGVLATLLAFGMLVVAPQASMAQDPTVAPPTQLSSDGRSVTDGTRTLSVSQVAGLSGEGQSVTVSASGYDETKGIYVALCAIPPRNVAPSPCGGGEDREGQTGSSTWISSNPPSYGVGVAVPYGAGGSFNAVFSVSPQISPAVDCRVVACAIVTRNDHIRSTDRSQDLFVPVTFAAQPGAPTTAATTTVAPETTSTLPATTTTTVVPAPEGTVAADGLSVSDGARTLSATTATDLDPSGAEIEIAGAGYSDTAGVLVALCAIGADGAGPGPCTGGSAGASAWISSAPPDYAVDLAEPYGDGGSFEVSLTVPAVIDAETDCREVACAITTRPDDQSPYDRSQELLLPVSFAADTDESTTTTETPEESTDDGASTDDDSSSSTPWVPIIVALILVAGASFAVWRWRSGPPE